MVMLSQIWTDLEEVESETSTEPSKKKKKTEMMLRVHVRYGAHMIPLH